MYQSFLFLIYSEHEYTAIIHVIELSYMNVCVSNLSINLCCECTRAAIGTYEGCSNIIETIILNIFLSNISDEFSENWRKR